MVLKLHTMVRIQKIQRQPRYWTMMPPNRGPRVGPSRGPRRYQPKTPALSLGWNMSEIVPPPFAIPTLPKNPLIVLTAIKDSTFGLNAVGICKRAKTVKQTRYNFRRPKISEIGARASGPRPRKTTKPAVAPTIVVSSVLRSAAISDMPGVNMLEARGDKT